MTETEEEEKEKSVEQELPPTKKYLPKPRKIIIPCVIPWENRPAKMTQKGMGAFGASRNAISKVSGGKPLTQGQVHSDNILSIFAEGNRFASQTGMRSFGSHRLQISKFTSSKELEKDRILPSEGIIPRQAGNNEGPSQSGETPMGAIRSQVPKIKFQDGMTTYLDPNSDAEVSKFWSPNPNNKAGTKVIDTRRQAKMDVEGGARCDTLTESIIPKLQQRKEIDEAIGKTRTGYYGLGLGRQVITPVKDTFMSEISEGDKNRSKESVPWATGPILASQQGTGGFQQKRDIVSKATDTVLASR